MNTLVSLVMLTLAPVCRGNPTTAVAVVPQPPPPSKKTLTPGRAVALKLGGNQRFLVVQAGSEAGEGRASGRAWA